MYLFGINIATNAHFLIIFTPFCIKCNVDIANYRKNVLIFINVDTPRGASPSNTASNNTSNETSNETSNQNVQQNKIQRKSISYALYFTVRVWRRATGRLYDNTPNNKKNNPVQQRKSISHALYFTMRVGRRATGRLYR